MRAFVVALCSCLLSLPAFGQGVMRMPVLCMEEGMFRAQADGVHKEQPLLYSETDGGGHIELWSGDSTYTLVYYPKNSAMACVISTGKKLIPGQRVAGPES